ncbi:hypothetical protein SRABI106_02342 [Rahnella aquatilis]|nr:hypothetical protein SRABI106_02342 [Rahnella aquatilis]
MSKYSTMDDGAINMLVGESLGLTSYYLNHDRSVQFRSEKGHIKGTKNYCNKPADAWPLILKHKINIDHRASIKAGAMAKLSGNNEVYAVNDNPLRAAMEVYLMAMDAGLLKD